MNTLYTTRITAAVIAVVAMIAAWGASRAQAIRSNEFNFSPISLTRGQSLQINIANTGGKKAIPIEMMIHNRDGKSMAEFSENVLPGQTSKMSLNADDIAVQDEEYRPVARVAIRALGGPDTRNLVFSLEVVDNETRKTVILHPGVSKGFNPQPDPPGLQ
jgi:hypothetical protein